MKMLAEAVKKLMRTDRPEMQVAADSYVGYVLGTTGCLKEGYQLGYEKVGVHYTYLDRVEWLCRCGITPYVEQLQNEVNILRKAINKDGVCYATLFLRETREPGGLPSLTEGLTLRTKERRALLMVTYSDLIQFCIFIVALVGLCYQMLRGKKRK